MAYIVQMLPISNYSLTEWWCQATISWPIGLVVFSCCNKSLHMVLFLLYFYMDISRQNVMALILYLDVPNSNWWPMHQATFCRPSVGLSICNGRISAEMVRVRPTVTMGSLEEVHLHYSMDPSRPPRSIQNWGLKIELKIAPTTIHRGTVSVESL